jgi:tetratricopeptide (TPR) repeat protein
MSGKERPVFGHITGISALAVNIQPTGLAAAPMEIPVNEIAGIVFESEPAALLDAQKKILEGDYSAALKSLEKAPAEEASRREIAEEIAYSGALCAAQLGLAGNGDVGEARQQMLKFVKDYPNNYHHFQACELVGNLLVAGGEYDKAEPYYATLAKAPWPDYKIRAQVAMGRALLAQGKAAQAGKAFDEAMASDAPGDLAEGQRAAAKVGKARCMADAGQSEQAIKDLEAIIAKADADNVELHALAYNALGTALRKAGRPPIEAELAFLHVHLQYSSIPEAHAEALANLVQLFTETHKPDRAREVGQILHEQYGGSRWAKGLK